MPDQFGNDGAIVSAQEIAAALPDTPTVRFIQDHFEQFGGIKVGRKYYFPPNWKEVLFNGAKPTFPEHPPIQKQKVGMEKDYLDQRREDKSVVRWDDVRFVRTGISSHAKEN